MGDFCLYMKYIYGPVNSRRLGFDLGISLTPHKTCSYDCVYCQLGKTVALTSQRRECVPLGEVIGELREWMREHPADLERLNFVTIAGFGEPTLDIHLGEAIREVKRLTHKRVAVITNASLMSDPVVRRQLLEADLVVPSLDSVTQDIFERIDRPAPGISVEDIIAGLIAFRQEYKGEIWLEVMLVKGVNDAPEEIRKLESVIERINPDKIQINSPVRSTTENGVLCLDREQLERIKNVLGGKVDIV